MWKLPSGVSGRLVDIAPDRAKSLAMRRSKGQGVIEIIASLLIFVIMICVMLSISLFLYVQHATVSAVREGARFAALNPEIGDPATQADGIDAVQDYLINASQQLAGMQIQPAEITVTPPDPGQPQGSRTVRVEVRYDMQNPIPIDGFMHAFGTTGDKFTHMPIYATATMRYEE